jgi:hypothetical protein
VATLYAVRWPEESRKAQETLAQAAGDALDDEERETDALIPASERAWSSLCDRGTRDIKQPYMQRHTDILCSVLGKKPECQR